MPDQLADNERNDKAINTGWLIALSLALALGPVWYWAVYGMAAHIGAAWVWTNVAAQPLVAWLIFLVVTGD